MGRNRIGIRLSSAVVIAVLASACSNPLGSVVKDDVARARESSVTVTANPATGSTLAANQPISLVFSKSMKTSSLSLTGDLATSSVAWSRTAAADDTATLSPPSGSFWPSGAGKSLTVAGTSQSGSTMKTITFTYLVSSLPSIFASAQPAGPVIAAHETLRISFTDSMDPSSVTLTGSLSGGSPAWTTTTKANDTLTLSPPAGLWAPGSGQGLLINGSNPQGFPMTQFSVSWDVFRGVTVSEPTKLPTVDDDGTISHPFRTIQAGINKAKTAYGDAGIGAAEVRVGAGTYSASCTPSLYVVDMREGVSLYGGYASDMKTRDLVNDTSAIEDTSIAGGTDDQDPARPVNFPTGITAATVFDGFTVTLGKKADYHAAVMCKDASPTMSNVTIRGRSGGNESQNVYGIFLKGASSAHIDSCDIDPGSAGWIVFSIYVNGPGSPPMPSSYSSPTISHSTIRGGQTSLDSSNYLETLSLNWGNATITHNTIYGGTSPASYTYYKTYQYACVWISECNPVIEDNHFLLFNSSTPVYGVCEGVALWTNSDPASVKRNNFDYTGWSFYHDRTPSADIDESNWNTAMVNNETYGTQKLFDQSGWANTSTAGQPPP